MPANDSQIWYALPIRIGIGRRPDVLHLIR